MHRGEVYELAGQRWMSCMRRLCLCQLVVSNLQIGSHVVQQTAYTVSYIAYGYTYVNGNLKLETTRWWIRTELKLFWHLNCAF